MNVKDRACRCSAGLALSLHAPAASGQYIPGRGAGRLQQGPRATPPASGWPS